MPVTTTRTTMQNNNINNNTNDTTMWMSHCHCHCRSMSNTSHNAILSLLTTVGQLSRETIDKPEIESSSLAQEIVEEAQKFMQAVASCAAEKLNEKPMLVSILWRGCSKHLIYLHVYNKIRTNITMHVTYFFIHYLGQKGQIKL